LAIVDEIKVEDIEITLKIGIFRIKAVVLEDLVASYTDEVRKN
jgi:hypothetical protein